MAGALTDLEPDLLESQVDQVSQVLDNPDLLELIFSFLDPGLAKTVRLVSRLVIIINTVCNICNYFRFLIYIFSKALEICHRETKVLELGTSQSEQI